MRRLLILALTLNACHGSPTEPVFATATLTGEVVFVESGAPVAGARVVAMMIMGTGAAEGRTDAQGRYSLRIPGGRYGVRVFAPGAIAPAFVDLIDVFPGTNTANFLISSNGCATMSGRVVDAVAHASISGATITFFGQSAVSAGDGSYQLQLGCPPHPASVSDTLTLDHPAYQHREILVSVPTYSTTLDLHMQPR